jgi:hypothetical protein
MQANGLLVGMKNLTLVACESQKMNESKERVYMRWTAVKNIAINYRGNA